MPLLLNRKNRTDLRKSPRRFPILLNCVQHFAQYRGKVQMVFSTKVSRIRCQPKDSQENLLTRNIKKGSPPHPLTSPAIPSSCACRQRRHHLNMTQRRSWPVAACRTWEPPFSTGFPKPSCAQRMRRGVRPLPRAGILALPIPPCPTIAMIRTRTPAAWGLPVHVRSIVQEAVLSFPSTEICRMISGCMCLLPRRFARRRNWGFWC